MSDDRLWLQAQRLHASRLFKTQSAEHAYAVVCIGAELGIGATTALANVSIIQGKPAFGAALVGALLRRSGRYSYRVREHDDTVARIDFLEREGEHWEVIGTSTFTLEDAQRAGLTASPTWKRFPRNLLLARALTNGARWYCPDVLAGAAYTPEELEGEHEVPVVPPVAPPAPVVTLDELVAEYGEQAILDANGGAIPFSADDLLRVAEELAHRWATGQPDGEPAPAEAAAEEADEPA
jgi:hypothetical protein